MHITIGKVTTRKNARQHYDINGRAHCGAGRGTIAATTRWIVDATVDPTTICRRCIKALRTALTNQPNTDPHATGALVILATPEQAAAREIALTADLIAFHIQTTSDRTTPNAAKAAGLTSWQYRTHLLAQLANDPLPAGFEDAA